MDLGIAGKVALVTGGARSLGKADASTLAARGLQGRHRWISTREGAEETAKEIAGGGRHGARLRVRHHGNGAGAGRRSARVEREVGPVDICVNNAGMIYTVGQLKDMRDEDWELNLGDQPDRDDTR